jgi:hypothetical protein
MTWTKLSDDFADDCYTLSPAARWLHVEGLIWSNRKLLDLRLDKNQLQRWATDPDAAAELVETGFWTDEGDHYLIRHHASYQRTREAVLNQQGVNKANRAKGKARPVREQASDIRSKTHPFNESSDEPSDEMDRTGQDRLLRGAVRFAETGNGSGNAHCRYCNTELRPSMKSQHQRGYCNQPDCMDEAKAELS